jgi:NADP-dependent 3-hydroxy acid dehydrogenase YdfG
MPTWFITGCSTGLGRAMAKAVLAKGWNAAITARDPASLQDIVAGHTNNALPLRLDVTDKAQVKATVEAAEKRFSNIDVLVNNAGYGYRGAVEEASEADIRQLFETNFFGLVDITQRVIPGMRQRRSGHVINISSVAGRMANPGSAFYSATKFAVGGLSDALRKEVGPLGVHVTVVEPGGFRTDFAGRSLHQSAVPIDDYAATAGIRRKENLTNDGHQPGDPDRAAQAIIQAVESPTPPFRLLLGAAAVKRVREELDRQRKEIDTWEEVAVAADYPT